MLTFKKTERQVDATLLHTLLVYTMLYGGSRSGKTFINTRNTIIRASKVRSRHLIARFRFNHVKQAIMLDTFPKVMRLCFPDIPYEINKSDYYAILPNGSEIWFGGLDDKERVEKVLGNEYSTIFLSECSQISWGAVLIVMTRLAENAGLINRMFFDCNPPGKKHWTYRLFEEKVEPSTGEPLKNPGMYGSLMMNPIHNIENLPPGYMNILENLPKRQRLRFLNGLYLTDVEGALWTDQMIIDAKLKDPGEEKRTVIAVDPAVTNNPDSDETGIIVCGLNHANEGVIEEDLTLKASTQTWAQAVVNAYHEYSANEVVAEANQGGDLVKDAINNIDRNIKVILVKASKGKFARAEPVAQLYELGKVAHLKTLPLLEQELTEWVPETSKRSPNRLDALVWGLTRLMLHPKKRINVG